MVACVKARVRAVAMRLVPVVLLSSMVAMGQGACGNNRPGGSTGNGGGDDVGQATIALTQVPPAPSCTTERRCR